MTSSPSRACAALVLAAAVGCASRAGFDPQVPANQVAERTGTEARIAGVVTPSLPPGLDLAQGLAADDAVALALWNNAAFQVSVSELGFARADLLEAGLLNNPVLSLLFPVGAKQFEAALKWPVEVLWERPHRVAAAQVAAEAAGQRLVQAGLELVASVRLAYADAALAADRRQLVEATAAVLAHIDTLTQSRLSAGDIGELEARGAHVDAARGRQEAERAGYDVAIANNRLRLLLGLPSNTPPIVLAVGPDATEATCADTADLLREALVARPDVRAAELGVEAAAAALGWERSRILALTAVLDANGQGRDGFELGPGLDAALPLFNRNQGGRARASAHLQRASAAYAAIQQQVAFEIQEAAAQLAQADHALATWHGSIISPLQDNLADADRSYAAGETSNLFVLENRRRLIDAQIRARELAADRQRARARLERALGRSCAAPPVLPPRSRPSPEITQR